MARKKDVDYYELFNEAIDYTCKIAEKLLSIIQECYEQNIGLSLEERIEEVHKLEHDADIIYKKVVFELDRAFMTPIEREDIMNIAYSIDNISDSLEDVAFRFWMFDINRLRPEVNQFVDIIMDCCHKAKSAVHEFKNFKKSKELKELISDLDILENKGDVLYRNAIRNLFGTEKEPIEVQKWRETFHDMEQCLDRCNVLGNALASAIVKNS